MKNLIIKGDRYTYKKADPFYNGKTSIFDLYSKPSKTKVAIYYERKEKLNNIYGMCGNSNQFSIYGDIIDENGVKHDVWITRCHNYILN